MRVNPRYVRWALWVAGALDVVWFVLKPMLEGSDPITLHGVLMAAGPALLAYTMRAPGHLSESAADEMANTRARDAVRASKMPKAP